MIHDLIHIPMRNAKGELCTIVPQFIYVNGIDDLDWYGRNINLDQVSKLSKYKTVEMVGNDAIERVFFTKEPIDLKSKWWTAKIPIYPVFYKIYHWPHQPFADVYRYLNGTAEVLDICDCRCTHQQTIYNRMFNMCWDAGMNCNDVDRNLARVVVSGDDEANLERYSDCHRMLQEDEYAEDSIRLPAFNTDLSSLIFTQNPTCKEIGVLKSKDFGFAVCKSFLANAPVPFEIDNNTIFSESEDRTARWSLHRLIYSIEQSAYTDMRIVLEFDASNQVVYECDMMSRYLGIGNGVRKDAPTKTMKKHIIENLRKWSVLTSMPSRPVKVVLEKTWLEEIFIEVDVGTTTLRFYFDLATYSLANLSFVDMWG